MKSELVDIVSRVCGVCPSFLRTDRDLVEYGLDSLRANELLIEIEEQFDVELEDDAVYSLRTIDDIDSHLGDAQIAA